MIGRKFTFNSKSISNPHLALHLGVAWPPAPGGWLAASQWWPLDGGGHPHPMPGGWPWPSPSPGWSRRGHRSSYLTWHAALINEIQILFYVQSVKQNEISHYLLWLWCINLKLVELQFHFNYFYCCNLNYTVYTHHSLPPVTCNGLHFLQLEDQLFCFNLWDIVCEETYQNAGDSFSQCRASPGGVFLVGSLFCSHKFNIFREWLG